MESEASRAKRTVVLSRNQIGEIVMDSDSDEEKHYACEELDEEEQPARPLFPKAFHYTACKPRFFCQQL